MDEPAGTPMTVPASRAHARARTVRAGVRLIVGAIIGAVVVWRSWDASSLDQRRWVIAAVILVMAAVAVALPVAQRRLTRPGLVPGLIGVVQFAIYACVPETGQIPQVTAAVVVLIATELGATRTLPWWVYALTMGLVMWTGIFGATGRESALIGSLFATWPILLVAAVPRAPMAIAAIGSVAVVTVARTGALNAAREPAIRGVALGAAISLAAAVVVAVVAARTQPTPTSTSRTD